MNPSILEGTAVVLDTETTAAKETPERKIEVIEEAVEKFEEKEAEAQA